MLFGKHIFVMKEASEFHYKLVRLLWEWLGVLLVKKFCKYPEMGESKMELF